ncbi:MAG: hypothetical protein GEU99_12760 [Luteitalea sp.]|nr:hypothetical protein [Luteitalea sp.]
MSFVRTVLGDVPVETLGVCYAHEHIIIDPSFATYLEPDFLLDSVDLAAKELGELAAAGVTAMVDSMPAACGRNARKLAEVSRRSGIHIVCPTGVHLRKYYPPGHWVDRLAVGELTELFVRDIEDGIDANDYAGPTLSRTAVRAGVIKVATGNAPFSPLEHRAFVAAACAHHQTGCPILTHTDHGAAAHEQCDWRPRGCGWSTSCCRTWIAESTWITTGACSSVASASSTTAASAGRARPIQPLISWRGWRRSSRLSCWITGAGRCRVIAFASKDAQQACVCSRRWRAVNVFMAEERLCTQELAQLWRLRSRSAP